MGGTLSGSAVAVRTIETGSALMRPMGTPVTLAVSAEPVAVPRVLWRSSVGAKSCPAQIAAVVPVDQPAAPHA